MTTPWPTRVKSLACLSITSDYSRDSSVCEGHGVSAIPVYSELNRVFLCPGH